MLRTLQESVLHPFYKKRKTPAITRITRVHTILVGYLAN